MKFTIHNLRMIKARFSSNGWVLAELFLVFIVMWFLFRLILDNAYNLWV